jgi:hypothetical protein
MEKLLICAMVILLVLLYAVFVLILVAIIGFLAEMAIGVWRDLFNG